MGIYAITGASSGIGAKTKELLIQQGHKVINIDLKDGDICVNLASQEGRQSAVDFWVSAIRSWVLPCLDRYSPKVFSRLSGPKATCTQGISASYWVMHTK